MSNYRAVIMDKRIAWNKGRLVGQKVPLKLQEIWSIRTRLEIANNIRELAMFNLGIDSKLRACDLVALKVADIMRSGDILARTCIVQHKTGTPVQFEITPLTRKTVKAWIDNKSLNYFDFLFPSRIKKGKHITTRSYFRIVLKWIKSIGLDPSLYGTHSIRRTKVSILYKRDKNLRAIQLLLGHKKIESTVRYLGIEVQDALEASEKLDI